MAIIFCRTKRRVDALEEALYIEGYNCEKLHSDISQAKRERVMKSFRKADLQYLIYIHIGFILVMWYYKLDKNLLLVICYYKLLK